MFTFLNTSILVGLGAAAIPLIIHLITRQKVKKIFFSSLIFLKELRTQKVRRIKIRQILLLIIRTLIILLLLLAFARPTFKGKLSSPIQSQAKTSAVILFDNSLSMGREINGKRLLDEAKEKVKELTELFRVGDEIYGLFLTSGSHSIYDGPRYDFKTVAQVISKTQVSHSSTDILSAIIKAKNILQHTQNLNKEIYLISDLQKSGFEGLQEIVTPILDKTNIRLLVIPCINNKLSNLGIVKVESANQIIEKGKIVELNIVIKNFGTFIEHNKLVQLFIEGKRSAQGTVNLKPGENQTLTFRIVPDKTGLLTGSILLEDDDLLLDNRRYFTLFVPDRISVLLVSKGSENKKFLKLIAEISPNIEVEEIDVNQINYNSFNNYDVLILSNIPKFEGSLGSELHDYIVQGGGLVVFLGSDVDLKNYNINFNQKFSLPIFTETIGDIDNRNSFLTLGKIDYSHPIFKGMFEKKPEQIESPKFYFVVNAKGNSYTNNIVELSNGNPFLSETKIGKGKVLLFLTATDPKWSDFYVKGIFVPLINRSITYLAGIAERTDRELLVDQEIKSVIQSKIELLDFKIEKPDGSLERVKTQIGEGTYNIDFQQTNLIGIYTLYSNEKQKDKWAINYYPNESNIDLVSEEKIREIVGKDNVTYIDETHHIKEEVLITRYGRELWKYFIAAALILLLFEMIIARESKSADII